MDFKKKQAQQIVEEMKEPNQTNQFLIGNCVRALESMEGLTIAVK
jgi:hypothetical protein